jgi:hypothetical protein
LSSYRPLIKHGQCVSYRLLLKRGQFVSYRPLIKHGQCVSYRLLLKRGQALVSVSLTAKVRPPLARIWAPTSWRPMLPKDKSHDCTFTWHTLTYHDVMHTNITPLYIYQFHYVHARIHAGGVCGGLGRGPVGTGLPRHYLHHTPDNLFHCGKRLKPID